MIQVLDVVSLVICVMHVKCLQLPLWILLATVKIKCLKSTYSTSLMLFHTDKPSKPNNLHVIEVLKDQIVLAWEPPTSLGNCPLKGYVIEKRDAKRNTWMPVQNVDSATVTFAVQKLLEGNEYFFRVAAENEIGVGEAAELFDGIVAKSPYGESCFGFTCSLPSDEFLLAIDL